MSTPGIKILQPGLLSTLQDNGRFGQTQLGLSNGGVADKHSYYWLNRLLGNSDNAPCIEITGGSFSFVANSTLIFALTGAEMPLSINGHMVERWRSHLLKAGDRVDIDFAQRGVRSYLGFQGGFAQAKQFGSVSTVLRDGVGGIDGGRLSRGLQLSVAEFKAGSNWQHLRLAERHRPRFSNSARLRLIPTYQQHWFSRLQQRRFFSSRYRVSSQADRMGYRLSGAAIQCQAPKPLLSEGIVFGAVQIPPDGQPIVLLQDRQTIGGYPKIGAVLSLDIDVLMQTQQGAEIRFVPISMEHAHNQLHLNKARREAITLEYC